MEAEQGKPTADHEARMIQEERNRIAKAIHDGVAQNLALLMLKMEIISRLADIDQLRMKAELSKAVEILEATVRELRATVDSLRTPDTERPHIVRPARVLASRFSGHAGSTANPDSPERG